MSRRGNILDAFGACGTVVSGQTLARRLGISRAAVWKHVKALERAGYGIEGVRARGYRLVSVPDRLSAEALAGLTAGRRLGVQAVVLEVTRSTNSDALNLGREGAPEGTVVLAETQTAGRGRLGRDWESPRAVNLYLSLLLRPPIAPAQAPQLSLVAGVAVAEALAEQGLVCGIKWPNDVVVVGGTAAGAATQHPPLRKVAGILTEIEAEADRVSFVVVGIGINVNSTSEHFSPEVAGRATSFLQETGRRLDRTALVARLLWHMEGAYEAFLTQGFGGTVAARWRALSVLDGRTVEVSGLAAHGRDTGEGVRRGTCAGIDEDGALLLETAAGGLQRVIAGDVTVQGGYD